MMAEEMRNLMEQMDELMDVFVKQAISMSCLECMNEDELEMLKQTLKFWQASKNLAIKQAKMMDEQNEKLNKIIRLLEKRA